MRTAKQAFTLVELMTVIAILSVLIMLSLSMVKQVQRRAYAASCASNLRQLGVATHLYLSDHQQLFFNYSENTDDGKLWYFGLEPWSSVGGPEGKRTLDPTKGPLYPYIQSVGGVEICKAFPYDSALWKPKFKGASYGYGYNTFLSGRSLLTIEQPSQVIIFGDCAEVNNFQAPASPNHPMLEEFYMIENTFTTVHFRHDGLAEMLFVDGHVEALPPEPGTEDARLPSEHVGRISPVGSMKWLW